MEVHRGNMIEVFEMIHGIDKVNLGKLIFKYMMMKEQETQFMFKN